MRRKPKTLLKKYAKGQADHIDAWLMSYADMITLLFIVVVIAIPITVNKLHNSNIEAKDGTPLGDPEHPYHIADHTGLLAVNTTYDEAYRSLIGVVVDNREDENIAVEKNNKGLWLDISVPLIFEEGTADIREEQMPLVKSLAISLKKNIPQGATIAIEGYTDDKPPEDRKFANNWELSSMQTAKIASLLVAEGIDEKSLHTTSYAGNSPIVPNTDTSGKPIAKNRIRNKRIVIKVDVTPENRGRSL